MGGRKHREKDGPRLPIIRIMHWRDAHPMLSTLPLAVFRECRCACQVCRGMAHGCRACRQSGLACPICLGLGKIGRLGRAEIEITGCDGCHLLLGERWVFDETRKLATIEAYIDGWPEGEPPCEFQREREERYRQMMDHQAARASQATEQRIKRIIGDG